MTSSAPKPTLSTISSSSASPFVGLWDPDSLPTNRSPEKSCLDRIQKDLKRIFKDPLPGIVVVPDDSNVTLIHALITGPSETPYEGGFFHFVLNFPDNYPHSPPAVKLTTTDYGQVRFNPNLYSNGKVCLSILGTWEGPSWTATQSLSSVCISIQSLMNEHPLRNEPGFEAMTDLECKPYEDVIRHETLRVAVLGNAEKDSKMTDRMPPQLKEMVRVSVPGFLDYYREVVKENLSKDGGEMKDPFVKTKRRFDYKGIGERIEKLARELEREE